MTFPFPTERLFHPLSEPEDEGLISRRLAELPDNPLTHSQLNQLMHRSHEAGMTLDFFTFYFLTEPENHPFRVPQPPLDLTNLRDIRTLAHLRWGIDRFALDAAFFFGDFRNAYRELRDRTYDDIAAFFSDRGRIPTEWMKLRGPVMPFESIAITDRHLVSELACKALDPPTGHDISLAVQVLSDTFNKNEEAAVPLKSLVQEATTGQDVQLTAALPLITEDIASHIIEDSEDISALFETIGKKFRRTRKRALKNTKHYLSICNELDIYVATSMRTQADFQETGTACDRIFSSPALQPLHLRWFDPTLSACSSHEDKGLIECLMVDQAQLVLHFAGEKDSWGKDAEAAMALSRGKPVVILCPDTKKGRERERLFRDIHPLSRLTDFVNGVSVGAMITTDENVVVEVMRRYFENDMAYHMEPKASGFVVVEELTGSVVRIVTADRMIRETFWNYYNSVPWQTRPT